MRSLARIVATQTTADLGVSRKVCLLLASVSACVCAEYVRCAQIQSFVACGLAFTQPSCMWYDEDEMAMRKCIATETTE